MLHHLANGVMMPRRYWRATAFLGVCTVLTFLGVQQQVSFARIHSTWLSLAIQDY